MNKKNLPSLIILLASGYFLCLASKVTAQDHSKSKIIFTKFTVSTKDKKRISIDWSTDNTVSTNYFEIQKSTDGKNFKTIALVLGPDPKQSTCDCYGCFDKYVSNTSRHSYYRLKHVDENGFEQLSETRLLATL